MLKVFATEVIVSKGYNGAPALRYSQTGDGVFFRVGAKVYDPKADKHTRWINLNVKGFGPVCERVRKMKLGEGMCVNLTGRYDEEVWEDTSTRQKKSTSAIILEDIEYCFTGSGKNSAGGSKAALPQNPAHNSAAQSKADAGNFTGFEPFGGGNAFFNA